MMKLIMKFQRRISLLDIFKRSAQVIMEERYPRNVLIDRCLNRMNDIYIHTILIYNLCHIKNIYLSEESDI